MPQQMYLSSEGLAKLKAELEHLRTVRRREVAQQIHQSRERGGTVGNAEYEEAKNELAFTEGRILTLDNIISNAIIIGEGGSHGDVVEIGSTVTVKDQNQKTIQYTITGSTEADPAHGKISNVSPIGRSLLGKRPGEITEVNAPSGKIKLEVVTIK
jgi:transcription elongation factor GreA